jgi:hypothetical protein
MVLSSTKISMISFLSAIHHVVTLKIAYLAQSSSLTAREVWRTLHFCSGLPDVSFSGNNHTFAE